MVSKVVARRKINNAKNLKKGDHICFWGVHNIFHHAIVTNTDGSHSIEVIHHNTNPGYPKCNPKGGIFREWLNLNKEKRILYKMVYNKACLPVEKTIEMATSLLGQRAYNLWSNNCEHFATLCKTGTAQCAQKTEFITALICQGLKYGGSAIKHTKKAVSAYRAQAIAQAKNVASCQAIAHQSKKVASAFKNQAAKHAENALSAYRAQKRSKKLASVVKDQAITQGKNVASVAKAHAPQLVPSMKSKAASAFECLSKNANIIERVMDGIEFGYDAIKAGVDCAKGNISKFEAVKVVAGKAAKIAVRAAATTIGAGVGTICVPGVGTYAGQAIGAAAGQVIGSACDWAVNKVTSWFGW